MNDYFANQEQSASVGGSNRQRRPHRQKHQQDSGDDQVELHHSQVLGHQHQDGSLRHQLSKSDDPQEEQQQHIPEPRDQELPDPVQERQSSVAKDKLRSSPGEPVLQTERRDDQDAS